MTLSVVIPVYNEGDGIRLLARRLKESLAALDVAWEVILVDDHSHDNSLEVMKEVCAENPGFQFLRLSRNCGSHIAILAGLEKAKGDCAVFMAADLQDPPQLIPEMLELWRRGHRVVWAVRAHREQAPLSDRLFARAFYWLMNRFGEVELPPDGADFALVDRRIIDSLDECVGANVNLFAEIARMGFSQAEVPYVKEERKFGTSKWTLRKRLKLFVDSFVSFSYAPLRAMSYLGMGLSMLGFLWALVVFVGRIMNRHPISGYASLMFVTLIIGGFQMTMLGVLGEYLWRTLDEARRRPKYLIEEDFSGSSQADLRAPDHDHQPRSE
jgi:polyisoprenyl-phosphate glycosyltransferase